jgi:hypothetical protein
MGHLSHERCQSGRRAWMESGSRNCPTLPMAAHRRGLLLSIVVAVVTGASKGIGLAVTKALVAEGARVIAGARDVGSELRSLAESGAVDAVSIDLTTPGHWLPKHRNTVVLTSSSTISVPAR